MVAALDRKLLRDLWRMKGQAAAIGLVIALGVLVLVMMQGLVNTLDETRAAYYERYRLADVFAPVVRAPAHLIDTLAQIDGVVAAEGRISGAGLIDLPEVAIPIHAQFVSLPDSGQSRLNDLLLVVGAMPSSTRAGEIVLLEDFAKSRNLGPGDTIPATINGARHSLKIVGLAQAPEFIYTTSPGEMMPDASRFAVVWMRKHNLAAAYDLQGAFNEALLSLNRTASLPAVLDQVDRLLDPYGAIGAYGLEDQMSNRFVSEEISGLRASSSSVPPIFLAVAAFLLYIVISRMVQSEREQIGLLKAFGYSSSEVSWHYLKFVLVVAIGGAIVGSLLGVMWGRTMAVTYQDYYKFPFLVFRVEPSSFIVGTVVSVLSASAGGLVVLRSVFALTPAVAMRPPAPADYSQSLDISGAMKSVLDQPTRMVLRRVLRHPWRMTGAVVGIATGMALSVAMISMLAAFDRTLDLTFTVIDRSDMTVSFVAPLSDKTILELQRIPGVVYVEPVRYVPAVLRNGLFTHRGSIDGLVSDPVLNRVLDGDEQSIHIRDEGIILAQALAKKLHIEPGETVIVEVREGRRPVLEIPVLGIAQTLMGAPAFMEIGAMNQVLQEPNRVSAAYLQIDRAHEAEIYKTIKDMPAVAGVSLKTDAKAAFERIMNEGAGSMRFVMTAIAGIITFGIVYNSARIAFAERSRDLASLQVIGFSRGEAAYVLLGELAIVTLAALPLGSILGQLLSRLIAAAFSTDLYQIPVMFVPASHGSAAGAVLIAAVISGWLVKRDLNGIDLVSALKTRE